ncbi:MAG: DUF262 domain-containing protein [Chromatiaceae bacterium]
MTAQSSGPQGIASAHTGFSQLFGTVPLKAIEIPLIQRDYAQGRKSSEVEHIRERFISELCHTLDDPSRTLDLDFVFGHVVDDILYPLDGQQRLTTLFLLHCYLSWHVDGEPGRAASWHAFSYATRPGARAFCEFLTEVRPQLSPQPISEWLIDQAKYLPTWKHDPTIQGMLVVLDTLHKKYWDSKTYSGAEVRGAALKQAWTRLTDSTDPAIRFHLLPITAQDQGEALYVKMNSRGKSLTDFENFKAELEELLGKNQDIAPEKVSLFSRQMDTDWADLFWDYRGNNTLIDEEFMRYLRFLIEVQAWKSGRLVDLRKSDAATLSELSEALLGSGQAGAQARLDGITQALNVWMLADSNGVLRPRDIKQAFERLFTREEAAATSTLRVFNFDKFDAKIIGVDMFRACCELYGTGAWNPAHTLLFHGVICAFIGKVDEEALRCRLRLLRNLIEASGEEIRTDTTRNTMPALLAEVESVMQGGALSDISTFNQVQVANEQAKAALIQAHPALRNELWTLEDHELLRGGLTAFDLDPAQSPQQFQQRASQFARIFRSPYQELTGALLAKGEYGRRTERGWTNHHVLDLGAPKNREPWQSLLRGKREVQGKKHPSLAPLMALLDDLAAGQDLAGVMNGYLASCVMDWRYYLVKYESMREGASGRYAFSPSSYQACMLDKWQFNSEYRDPYLRALVLQSAFPEERVGSQYFTGYENQARDLVLTQSGLLIRSVDAGWRLEVDSTHHVAFTPIAAQFGCQGSPGKPDEWLYAVTQSNGVDTEDRIVKGATLLQALIAAGL